MAIFESQCNSKACPNYGLAVEWLGRWDDPEPFCEECGHSSSQPTRRLLKPSLKGSLKAVSRCSSKAMALSALGSAESIFGAFAARSKTMFKLQKAAGIAQGLVES